MKRAHINYFNLKKLESALSVLYFLIPTLESRYYDFYMVVQLFIIYRYYVFR